MTAAKRLQQIDRRIARTRRDLAVARKKNRKAAIRRFLDRLQKLRELRTRIARSVALPRPGEPKTSSASPSAPPERRKRKGLKIKIRLRKPKEERKGPFWRRHDPYRGVIITAANAPKLVKFYQRRLKQRITYPAVRAYYVRRLNEALRVLGRGGAKGQPHRQAAERMRVLAAQAKSRRDYAASTRYARQAEVLDQQAYTADSVPEEPSPWTPDGEGYVAARSGGASSSAPAEEALPDTTDEALDLEEPWYKRPAVLAGAALIAGVAIFFGARAGRGRRGGGGNGGGGKKKKGRRADAGSIPSSPPRAAA